MSDDTTETELTHRRELCLEITEPGVATYVVTLADKNEVIIGRSRSADIRIDHRSVSREHARLSLRATLEIEDLGSNNGTRVRGMAIAADQRSTIGLGEAIELGNVAIRIVPVRPEQQLDARPISHAGSSEGWYTPSSSSMQVTLAFLERVAPSNMNVLLVGEPGVGMEACAELLHRKSPRAARDFVCLDCGTRPEAALEEELFGHASDPGILERAHGGTVMLDDVAALPAAAQIKLLRVLDRRDVVHEAVSAASVDVRFMAAARTSLEDEVAAGRFRSDLYYRLAGVTIPIPPLRERRDEIVPLANQFLAAAARARHRPTIALSVQAIAALEGYAWPGNIGELREVVERAVSACGGGPIDVAHLAFGSSTPTASTGAHPRIGSLGDELETLERHRIDAALVAAGGNQSEAARRLGMSRGALLARLRAWGIVGQRGRRSR